LYAALAEERHRRLQIPPQVSAIKVDGQRSYARARQGEVVDLAARDVKMHDLALLDEESITAASTKLSFRLVVSKGYYVRSFAQDLGQHLGVPAHLSALRRIASGPFSIAQAEPWPPTAETPLISVAEATRIALPCVQVNEEGALRLEQGKHIFSEHIVENATDPEADALAAFHETRLLALIERAGNQEYRVKRGMNDPAPDK
jgi:tRNA pseudouridine55 synthase